MSLSQHHNNHAYPSLPLGYKIIEKLGQGGYGDVYHCIETATGRELAVKQIRADEKGIPAIMEANIMATISQPHLVIAEKIISDGNNIFLFQEKAKCDLGYLIRKKKQLPTPHLLRQWAYSLVQAIACLHQQNIVHADIKASNILLFEDEIHEGKIMANIKLADFNLSQKIWHSGNRLSFRACTCTHRPFEVWLGLEWDFSIDIWSLGCTLFEIAYGCYLFPYQGFDDSSKHVLEDRFIACLEEFARKGPGGPQVIPFNFKIHQGKYLPFSLPTTFYNPENALLNQLILSMLRFNPSERPLIDDILKHPYFHGFTPALYKKIIATEEKLAPKKEHLYLEQLHKLTIHQPVIELSLSMIRKIQHLRFRYPNLEDDRLRLIGVYWLATKLILRRTPSLSYPLALLHRVERRICEYLSYRLIG